MKTKNIPIAFIVGDIEGIKVFGDIEGAEGAGVGAKLHCVRLNADVGGRYVGVPDIYNELAVIWALLLPIPIYLFDVIYPAVTDTRSEK